MRLSERSGTVSTFTLGGCSTACTSVDAASSADWRRAMATNTSVTSAMQVLEKQLNRPLTTALEVCARCGICAEACHYYVADPKLEHVPAFRAEQLRQVYRQKHDFFGRFFPAWVNAKELDETTLERLAEIAFSECTLCRRCTFNCPMGVDTPLMMRTIRGMATEAGKAPESLEKLAGGAVGTDHDPGQF